MSENDSVVLGSTYGKNPRSEEYRCPLGDQQFWSEYPPNCPHHKIRMEPTGGDR